MSIVTLGMGASNLPAFGFAAGAAAAAETVPHVVTTGGQGRGIGPGPGRSSGNLESSLRRAQRLRHAIILAVIAYYHMEN